MKHMKKTQEIIDDCVFNCIFERGWVEQTPDEFLDQVKSDALPMLKKLNLDFKLEELNDMIFSSLTKQLGDEYDVNIYRLKHFPSEKPQTYDV